ncbi:unnamed protein product [Brassicogethes aeneus]|uniref:Prolyl endopeptidase n=1 Tax=Brassicogethes aeneus TaxID=1431903 RepID=A0A9P0B1N4_BRAAE|nr:unnamed protein product [Brassicogethes aeneus]
MRYLHKFLDLNRKLNIKTLQKMFPYPEAIRDENVVDDYFGIKVPDPYRWLEDPETEETKNFINQQNSVTDPFLRSCPYRDNIKRKLIEIWDYPKFSTPLKRGKKYFQFRNSGLENQSSLHIFDDLRADGTVLLDPNQMAEDGTVTISEIAISENHQICAYSLNAKGSDWAEIKFKDVLSGKNYDEVLTNVKFSSMTWMHDNVGFFYGAYLGESFTTEGSETEQIAHQKLYYHRLGTDQSEDIVAVEFPENPDYIIGARVSHCGKYLVVMPSKGCKTNLLYYAELPTTVTDKLKLRPLVTDFVADFSYVTNNGTQFIVLTDKNASNGKMVIIDIQKPDEDNWRILVPEHDQNVLVWVKPIDKDKMMLCYMKDVKHVLQLNGLNTGEKILDIQMDMGTIENATGRREDNQIFYSFTSFLTPKLIHKVTLETNEVIKNEVIQEIKINNESLMEDFETKQVFYKSKDATNIPMFIIHAKDLELNGRSPCLLYGYGGFNINLTPSFSLARLLFIKNFKGVVAIANIRGGGEYGDKWHSAGRTDHKQNCFDDFQYAARYLIGSKYTCPEKLAIQGGSNGGLLVAACINQAPELYGAALAHVGVMDMLRFHKFTIGYAWKTDYGSSEDPNMFHYLYKYSPLHNVKVPENGVQYPATMLLTADHDDRVVPLHSYKYIAELQNKIGSLPYQKKPLLIKVETKAGHGAGKPTTKKIDELTDVFCFLSNVLKIKFYE